MLVEQWAGARNMSDSAAQPPSFAQGPPLWITKHWFLKQRHRNEMEGQLRKRQMVWGYRESGAMGCRSPKVKPAFHLCYKTVSVWLQRKKICFAVKTPTKKVTKGPCHWVSFVLIGVAIIGRAVFVLHFISFPGYRQPHFIVTITLEGRESATGSR